AGVLACLRRSQRCLAGSLLGGRVCDLSRAGREREAECCDPAEQVDEFSDHDCLVGSCTASLNLPKSIGKINVRLAKGAAKQSACEGRRKSAAQATSSQAGTSYLENWPLAALPSVPSVGFDCCRPSLSCSVLLTMAQHSRGKRWSE